MSLFQPHFELKQPYTTSKILPWLLEFQPGEQITTEGGIGLVTY